MKDIISLIEKQKIGKVLIDEPLKKYNTYKIGGIAKCIVFPKNEEKLIKLLKIIKDNNIKFKVIGKGSNIIFSSKDYDGILIRLDEFNKIEVDDIKVVVGAGYSLMKLALEMTKKGLSGLEFATGIPGSIGGAVYMNAGAYNSDMGYIVSEVKVIDPNLNIITLYNKDLDFHYRTSFFQKNPEYICIEATIILKNADKKIMMDIIEDRKRRRLMTQPLEYPSAGSVFRNPENVPAGKLIEDAGLKGKTIGGAMVSKKHANFIINYDNATSDDIYNLINLVKKEIKEKTGIELKQEQEFVNWE
ncbi:MAG: UDP-N-acetylmuramate dehydrogenase [Bacilli bacterium]|nr:UDP-N-acetylmuramate dehydrogenase [Bacilli bacterium]